MQPAQNLFEDKIQEEIKAIKSAVREDELEDAYTSLEELATIIAPGLQSQITLNQSSLFRNKRAYTSGEIAYDEYFRIRTRVSKGLLNELQELRQHIPVQQKDKSKLYLDVPIERTDFWQSNLYAIKFLKQALGVVSAIPDQVNLPLPKQLKLDENFTFHPGEHLFILERLNHPNGKILLKETEIKTVEKDSFSLILDTNGKSFYPFLFNRELKLVGLMPDKHVEDENKGNGARGVPVAQYLSSLEEPQNPKSEIEVSEVSKAPSIPQIFMLYNQKEKDYAEDLMIHLKLIGGVDVFDMHKDVGFGDKAKILEENLQKADLVLCLVSPRLFMFHNELLHDARINKGKTIVPILVKSVDWENTVLGGLNCLPIDKQFIAQMEDTDIAFSNIAKRIKTFLRAR